MKNYRVQNCCNNCKFSVIDSNYDYIAYYCNYDNKFIRFPEWNDTEEEYLSFYEWANGKGVAKEGICDLWEEYKNY